MQSSKKFLPSDVAHIATLANIPVTEDEEKKLAEGFNQVMLVVDNLKKAHTEDIGPVHQVTDLSNVLREDMVDEDREFSQDEALRNAKRTYNGYFVTDQVIDK